MGSWIGWNGIMGFIKAGVSNCGFCMDVGTVIAANDDEEDVPPNTEDFISKEGNQVYIQIKETGTYLLLNHLKKDSVMLRPRL